MWRNKLKCDKKKIFYKSAKEVCLSKSQKKFVNSKWRFVPANPAEALPSIQMRRYLDLKWRMCY